MQNLTLNFIKLIVVFYFFFFTTGVKAASEGDLKVADSLYKEKKFIQSFEIYESIYTESGLSSPSMLLKMAFIKEGLGDFTQALYYLNKYYLISLDNEVLVKMEKLAGENNLTGYKTDESDIMFTWYRKYYSYLVLGILALGILLFSINLYLITKNKKRPIPAYILMIFILLLTFGLTNYGELPEEGIIQHPKTLAMGGPASSAKLVQIYSPGHKVTILDKQDVWYKLLVDGEIVYIRDHNIIPLGR